MNRLLALLLFLPLLAFGQGTSVRSLNGFSTNTTYTGAFTNQGAVTLRLGAGAAGSTYSILDTNGLSRIAIIGRAMTFRDTNTIRFRFDGDSNMRFYDTLGSNQVSIAEGGLYSGTGLVIGTTNETFTPDRAFISGNFDDVITPTVTAENGSFSSGKMVEADSPTISSGGGSFSGGDLTSSSGSSISSDEGSFSGGWLFTSTNSSISSSAGSFSGGFGEESTGALIESASGSFSGGNVEESDSSIVSSTGSFSGGAANESSGSSISSQNGSISVGNLSFSTNATIASADGSITAGNLQVAQDSSLESEAGSFAMAHLDSAVNAAIVVRDSGIAGVQGANSSGLEVTVESGLVGIYANTTTNVSITATRSMIVGAPSNTFTGTFESTVGVLGMAGLMNGFDTNYFFGNAFGLTNILERNVAVTTNGWGTSVINFALGTQVATNMSGGLTLTGIQNFVGTNLNWQTISLNPNGSDRVLTVPAEWWVSGFTAATTVTIPAAGYAKLRIESLIGLATNASIEIYQ